jgi:hypothetical protein
MNHGEREKAAEMHTPEPWRFNEAQADIDGQNGEAIAVCYWNDDDGEGALLNGRRIVACVNACAGIPTDHLERCNAIGAVDEILKERNALKQQRDELLLALIDIIENGLSTSRIRKAREAIAKVKGEAA